MALLFDGCIKSIQVVVFSKAIVFFLHFTCKLVVVALVGCSCS